MSPAREQEQSENNERENEDEMTESEEGEKGIDKGVDECGIENVNGNNGENRED